MKCVYTNASSLFHKSNEVKLRAQQYDVIVHCHYGNMGEEDMTDAELSIYGFVMFRSDREGRLGGGVLLMLDHPFQFSLSVRVAILVFRRISLVHCRIRYNLSTLEVHLLKI
jgi:hypothetical protein